MYNYICAYELINFSLKVQCFQYHEIKEMKKLDNYSPYLDFISNIKAEILFLLHKFYYDTTRQQCDAGITQIFLYECFQMQF